MFKKKLLLKSFVVFLASILFSSVLFSSAQATESDTQKKVDAINKSSFYNVETNEIMLSKDLAKSFYDFSDSELKEIEDKFRNLTQGEIDYILKLSNVDLDEIDVDENVAHANWVWVIPVVAGIIVAGGIIFSALYFSHKEKQNLINKCYKQKGKPVIDSRDSAGLKGTTKSGSAKKAGGYKFECKKK